jgi:DNA helicase-2/ATP-dependent DNA helicase PcrA
LNDFSTRANLRSRKRVTVLASWDSLSADQKAAVFHDDGPAAVYAGPGSGKTRVVTLRAARMAEQGRTVLVTTFTTDATSEMKTRIGQMLSKERASAVKVSTVHALCLQILRTTGASFQLLTDEFQRRSLAEAARATELEGGIARFLADQSYQKNTGTTSATYRHDGSTEDIEFARVWRDYEKAKQAKGLREFDDIILDVIALFRSDDAVRKSVAARFTHIIVDECQDMNAPQYAVVFALGQDHKNVMLVGDLDQSLYGFRGADTVTFERFAAHRTTKVYELRSNYRSTQSILRFADGLIRKNPERRALSFVPVRDQGADVTWQRYDDPDVEALGTAEQLLMLHDQGVSYHDMAVLYRTNAQSEAFERHFAALEIPYSIKDDGDFYARKEIQGILSYLNFFSAAHLAPGKAHSTGDSPSPDLYPDEWLIAVLNVPNRKIARTTGPHLRTHAEFRGRTIWESIHDFHAPDLRSHRGLRQMTDELKQIDSRLKRIYHAGEAIKIIRSVTEFDDWLRRDQTDDNDNDRIQNLQRMQAAAAHYATIEDYLAAVQKVRDEAARRKSERAKKRREQNEVTLSTGHAAKGLEWRCVFAVGWSEEILPHRKAEDIIEELRIAYVIATRARDLLFISSLDSWNDATVAPSRFLSGSQLAAPAPGDGTRIAVAADSKRHEPELGGLFIP